MNTGRKIVVRYDTEDNASFALNSIKSKFMNGIPLCDDLSHREGSIIYIKNRSALIDALIRNYALNLPGALPI